jgi:predicted ATP-binding protein involved in virulence
MLSDFELLHRENLFIRLKNQGKSLDEIAVLLDVERELVEKWNEEIGNALLQSNKHKILRRTPQNEYIFETPLLDRILIELHNVANLATYSLPKDIKIDAENLKETASIALLNIIKYVSKVELNETDATKLSYVYWRNEQSYDIENEKIIEDALNFWLLNFYIVRKGNPANLLIKQYCPDLYSTYYQVLPYSVKQIKIKNYHDIRDLYIERLNIDAQWIFLFGENGFGKTSILQAIALGALINSEELKNIKIKQPENIGIEFINNYVNQINNWHENPTIATENVVCYGSSRLNMGKEDTKENEIQKSGVLYSLFHTDGILLNIEKYLKEWFLAKDARFGKVIEAFKIIIPYLHDIQVIKHEQTREYEVHYFEKIIDETGEATGDTQKVSFNELAAGLKSVLAMVGDMFIRLYRTQPTVENPSELVGIAIIDELELHLHPKWQMKLPLLLSTVFPKVQFIASTHSAIPLLGAPSNAIFIKVTRDKEKGIQAEKVAIDINNLTPNQLLYFLFDMEKITSVNNTDLSKVRTETTKEDFIRNDEVQRQLKALENTTDFPDDLFN